MTNYPELPIDAINNAISFVQNEPNGIAEAFRNLAFDQLQALLDEIGRLTADAIEHSINDIVTRLRANNNEHHFNNKHCVSCDGFCCHCELCDCCLITLNSTAKAADEIERLRAEITKMKEQQ